MKLLLLSTEFPPGPGGIGMLAYQIADQLTQREWNIITVTPQHHAYSSEIKRFNANQPFKVLSLPYIGPLLFEGVYRFYKSYQAMRQQKQDILLAVGEQAVWLGAILSLLTRRPFIAIGIGSEFVRGGRIRHYLTQWAFNQASHLIAISIYTETLMRDLGVTTDKLEVILCGADSKIYQYKSPQSNNSFKWVTENDKIILTVGQVSFRKAQDIVIQALPYVKKLFPHIKYLIAGLPTEQPQLEVLATQLGVADQVIFLGKVAQSDLPILYNQADLFVLVSRQTDDGNVEGYGIVVTEAALCGTTSIVANHSGLTETIIANVTGLIVEPENPEATAHAINRLLADDLLRRKMGEAAQQYAINNATWEKRIDQYDQLLKTILAETI